MPELYNEIKNAICNHDELLCLSVEANGIIKPHSNSLFVFVVLVNQHI